jgi:hypothetical protein
MRLRNAASGVCEYHHRSSLNVVLLANMPWKHDGETNRQSWARALLATMPNVDVTYVETIGWQPLPRRPRPVLQSASGTVRVQRAWNLLPWAGRPANRRRRTVNIWLTCALLRAWALLRHRTVHVDLVTIFDPLAADAVGRLSAGRVIYDCLDFYGEQPQFRDPKQRNALAAAETRLAHAVDSLWASSRPIAEHLETLGRAAHFAPGALMRPNWAPIARGDRQLSPPRAARGIYVGALDPYKVDIDVFWRLLRCDFEVYLVIIGGFQHSDREAYESYAELAAHPRVRCPGTVLREGLEPWLSEADFGIVAMTPGSYSDGSFPLKYWDYQWAGLPTLTVHCPALAHQPGVVACETTQEIDSRTLASILDMRREASRYPQHAAQHDAEARVRKILGE